MPKFKPGDPKPPNSGRKKGVKNKKVTPKLLMTEAYQALQEGLHQAGFDLLKELNGLYKNTDNDQIKLSILKMLLDRSIPELRAVDYEQYAPTPEDERDEKALLEEDEDTLLAKLNEE